MRLTVDKDFVKQWFDQIVEAVEDGVMLVEHGFDKYVDPDELRTLAFGSEEEQKAYEDRVQRETEEAVAEQQKASEERRAAEDEQQVRSVMGDLPFHDRNAPVGGTATPGDEFSEEPPYDNIAGSHALPHLTSPREKADALQREAAEQQAAETQGENPGARTLDANIADEVVAGEEDVEEPEVTDPDTTERAANDANFKPLPSGWRHASKPELLAYCEERGIDTSDMPSNKELRKRLDSYLTGTHG